MMVVLLLVACGGFAGAGCGTSNGAPSTGDAGLDDAGGPDGANTLDGRDEPGTIIVKEPNCETARTVCRGTRVMACAGRNVAEVIEECAASCSLGRCTSRACADAEIGDAARGCRFYGAQVDNADLDDNRPTMVLVSNAGQSAANVRVETRELQGTWTLSAAAVVRPGGTERLEISRPLIELGLIAGGGYRVESDAPVMVVEIISDDTDRMSRSSGGTVLRPVQALGWRHLAVTAPARNSPEVARTAGGRNGAGAIAIVATMPDTSVQIAVTAVAMAMPGQTLQPLGPGEPPANTFLLQEGDVLQLFSIESAGDLTGSEISADFPVAVFSGNVFTTYGYAVVDANGGDLIVEQLPPVESWGLDYVGARLAPAGTCDSFFGSDSGSGTAEWRVVASQNGTEVTVTPAAGATIEIAGAAAGTTTFGLDRGGSRSFLVRGPNPDVFVHGSHPILPAQWLDCEPALSWGIDTRVVQGELAFGMPPGFESELVVVRDRATPVSLDGKALSNNQFRPVGPDDRWQVARITDLGRCLDGWDRCEHRLSGAFGAAWRGMDVVCSYALTVPSRDPCTLPSVFCTF